MKSIHVETLGAGPPLVLLHGWAMHGGMFADLLPALARGYGVHVVDLPGHGHSATAEVCTLDGLVDALDERMRGLDGPLTLLGWSLGGMAALRWAQRQPARIRRLVLVGTTPRFVAGPDWPHAMEPETLRRFGDELELARRLTLQRFLALQVQGSDEGRRTLSALRAQVFSRGEPSRDALASSLAILAAADLRAEVPEIVAPTLVITGEHDRITPAAAGAWLAGALPQGRLVNIAGAAHAPFLSHRAAFDAALEGFLDAA